MLKNLHEKVEKFPCAVILSVQSATHVKITDFGLAKLVNEDGQFYAASGRVR